MKKKASIVAIVGVGLLVAGLYAWGPSSVPSGQKSLTVLSPQNLSEFGAAFDENPNVPRMVLLLSPT